LSGPGAGQLYAVAVPCGAQAGSRGVNLAGTGYEHVSHELHLRAIAQEKTA